MTEPTLKEKYEDVVRRYNSMCEAAEKDRGEIRRLAAENSVLKTDVIRLGAEARVAQQNAQLLGDDFNERTRAYGREIADLRMRLREYGDTEAN